MLTTYFRSLKERILAAGYESADIDYIGFRAVPGAKADKELTEKCTSCIILMEENLLTFLRQLGDVSELKWKAHSAVLARDAYTNGAAVRG
jgi:hypothetical protein